MEYTKNLKLSKPSYDDDVDIQILNKNMDILDGKVGDLPYLPLKGGTMTGDIVLPYNKGKGIKQDETHFIEFNETTFKGVKKQTLSAKSDRFKFYCPSGKEFVVDDTGAWYNGDMIVQDKWTSIGTNQGYTKLSNGMLQQWGYATPDANIGSVKHVTFQTPFSNSNYVVFVSKGNGTSGRPVNDEGDWRCCTFNCTTTGFDVFCDQLACGKYQFWLAIGKGV